MNLSSTYICPDNGLVDLDPPEVDLAYKTARSGLGLGVERLILPVVEESLTGSPRSRMDYLDGLIGVLEVIHEAGAKVALMPFPQRIMGLDLATRDLVRPKHWLGAKPVFTEGKLRELKDLDWWRFPRVISRRIATFRELASAVSDHPAISDWVLLNRWFDRVRPDATALDLVLKSLIAEIRERDEEVGLNLGISATEIFGPELIRSSQGLVDGFLLAGAEKLPGSLSPSDPVHELGAMSYAACLVHWLTGLESEIQLGWVFHGRRTDQEKAAEWADRLIAPGVGGISWISLQDPSPEIIDQPPWRTVPGLATIGLFDRNREPKGWTEAIAEAVGGVKESRVSTDFIDLDNEEYLRDPGFHGTRLWDRFRESVGLRL